MLLTSICVFDRVVVWLWVEDHYVPSTVDSCSGGVVVFNTDYGQVRGGGGVCITQEQWLNICSVQLSSKRTAEQVSCSHFTQTHTSLCTRLYGRDQAACRHGAGTRYTEMARNSVKPVSQLSTVCLCFNVCSWVCFSSYVSLSRSLASVRFWLKVQSADRLLLQTKIRIYIVY